MLNVSVRREILRFFLGGASVLAVGCGQITAELGEIIPTEVSTPSTALKIIYLDTTQLTLTEGSAAIINIAVDQKYSTDTIVTVTMPDPTGRFQTLPILVTIPANTLSVPLTLQTIDNATYQAQAIFQLSISSAEASLSQGNRLLQITLNDNDAPPASNHAPVIANSGPFFVLSGSSIALHAASSTAPGIATDSDNDAMTLTVSGTPVLGTLSNNGTSVVTFSPTSTGVESLSVTIADGNGGSVSGTVLVHVVKPMTWTGASSTSWSTASNWCGAVSADNSACLGNGPVPGASDIAIIDATCVSGSNCNPVVNASINIGGLELSGHTLNQASSRSIAVGSSGWVQVGGNFLGSDAAITISGKFQVSGTSTFQSTSSTLTLPGSNINVGNATTFTHSSGTVNITGATGTVVWPAAQNFYNLSIGFGGAGSTLNLNSGTYTVLHDFTVRQDACGSASFINAGTLQVARNFVGLGSCTPQGSYLVRLNGSSAQAINFTAVTGTKQMGSLEIASSSNVTISESLNILGSWTYTSGTVDLTGSTLNFVAGGTIQPGNLSYNNVSFLTTGSGSGGGYNLSAGTMKVYGDLQLATLSCVGGIASINNGSLELYGTNLIAGYASASSCGLQGTAVVKTMGTNHTLDASLASTHEVPNLSLNHSGTLTLVGTPKFVGSYQRVSGSINAGTTTASFAGGILIESNGSAFYDLVIEGNGTTTLTGTLVAYHDLTFDEKTAGGSAINGGTLQVGRNIANADNLGMTGTTSINLQALGSPTTIHQNAGQFPKGNWTISTTGTVSLLSALNLSGASQNLTLSTGSTAVLDMAGFDLSVGNILTLDSNTKIITGCGALTPSSGVKLVNNGSIVDGSNVNLSINDVTVNEGSDAIFTVSLSGASCKNVTLNYATSDGTAVAGTNYTAASGSKTITTGNTSTTITVSTLSDNYYRAGATRTFNLTLSSVTGSNVIDNVGVGSVTDIDAQPSIAWTTASTTVSELAGSITLNVALNKPSTQAISASWATSNNGAVAGTNYTSGSGTVTIAAGQTTGSVSVTILHAPAACQSNLLFNTTLSSPTNATLGATTVISTEITETDFPTISVADISITEGAMASVPITLNAACASTDITVSYSTGGGTAVAGTDYAAVVSRTATIYAGDTVGYAPVTTFNGSAVEGSRNFLVTIGSPSKGSITTSSATVTVQDNDVALAAANDVVQVANGGDTVCVRTNTGTVKCWGSNTQGSVGNGTQLPAMIPTTVTGLATTASKICVAGVARISGAGAIFAGAEDFSCAALTDGRIQCWGRNSSGQLGDGTQTMRASPTLVNGIASGATDVACGVSAGNYATTCAIISGGAKCWGHNDQGQVGNGTSGANVLTPADVSISASYVVEKIAVGESHACAIVNLTGTRSVKCWGLNTSGQLGDGTNTSSTTPVDVLNSTGATDIASGRRATCAVISGAVKCWGSNSMGELGDNTGVNKNSPVQAVGLTSGFDMVAMGGDNDNGYNYGCAKNTSGAVYCWGANYMGQGGYSGGGILWTPNLVSSMSSNISSISAGGVTTCAVNTSGSVSCMGNTTAFQFGNYWGAAKSQLQDVLNIGSTVSEVGLGRYTSCATLSTGAVKCWGANSQSQIGDGTTTLTGTPTSAVGLTSNVTKVVSGGDYNGYYFSCALINDGTVKCWGNNQVGQVGVGTVTASYSTPTTVPSLSGVVDIAAAHEAHACAVINDGTVKCWGRNDVGQLGNNSTTNSNVPVSVVGITNATALALGQKHSCALLATGSIQCWGLNNHGQLGNNSTTNSSVPVTVTGITGATSVTAYTTTCAIVSGAVKCWGYGSYGTIGDGGSSDRWVPTQTTGLTSGWVEVSASWYSVCARNRQGTVKCWGNGNTAGELLVGSITTSSTPTSIIGAGSGFAQLSSGENYHCMKTFDGYLKCGGLNSSGQLGDGHNGNSSSSAVTILFP